MYTDPSRPNQDAHPEPSEPGRDPGPSDRSRRRLLGAIGAGAAAAVALPAAAAAQNAGGGDGQGDDRDGRRQGDNDRNRGGDGRDDDDDRNGRDRNDGGPDRFDRLFDLPSFAEPSESLREALVEIGRPGGILDAGDPLDVGPVRLITEPDLSPNNRDHLTQFAGFTFLGQFIDHDLTNDAGSRLGQVTPVRRSTNLRTARFDLDSVYGGGPAESPMLYDGFRFRVESGGLFEDLPRDDAGAAIIGDPRNDENLIISGLQAAFLLFHNAVLDGLSANPTEADFVQARQIVRWHYQWIVVNEVLPHYVGQDLIDEIVASGRQIFTPNQARIPVEFQTSVYRFGHSIIRPSYRANLAGDRGEPFFAFVFDPSTFGDDDPEDLSGGHRAPRRFIGWQTFFDFGDGEVKPTKRIDTQLSTPLFQLPMGTIPTARGEEIGPTSLATRNLLRHITWEIPSGQAIASAMGVAQLSTGDLADIGDIDAGLAASTPLFLYVLREADVMTDGLRLGPVGGRITAEVFLGLLDLDPTSYRNADGWRPTLPQRSGSVGADFTMVDLLTIAGVDPTSRGQ